MSKKTLDDVSILLKRVGVQEADLEEKFIIGSGPGGQNLQKTASCVWLKHTASGIEVKCQQTRSRAENRRIARRIICEELLARKQKKLLEEKALTQKRRREKRVRSKKQKAKL